MELFSQKELQAYQITSPLNKKIGCSVKQYLYFVTQSTLLLNEEVIWQATDSI